MVLDNWGTVHEWTALAPITSRGPSGIGMVQFGRLDTLRVDAPIETFGLGARGFNLYAGTMKEASFQSIRTHADGAIGIHASVMRGAARSVQIGGSSHLGGGHELLLPANTRDETRTRISLRMGDFESPASTNSATRARLQHKRLRHSW